jgi:hypothetical protein
LQGNCVTGEDVATFAVANWDVKFKAALDINDPETKLFYDQLIIIRRQLRNFVAHGSFGKQGEAFSFHSGAGAVPVRLPHQDGHHSVLGAESNSLTMRRSRLKSDARPKQACHLFASATFSQNDPIYRLARSGADHVSGVAYAARRHDPGFC